jgi:hypothetical protein
VEGRGAVVDGRELWLMDGGSGLWAAGEWWLQGEGWMGQGEGCGEG